MVFTKTEVDIHEDYVVEAVDPAWLAEGVKSPKHLMLDPDNCILCRACEDVCPWNCIYMLSTDIVEGADEQAVGGRGRTSPPRSSWSTTTRARAAPCASTDAPPTPCTMRACRRVRPAASARWPRSLCRRPRRSEAGANAIELRRGGNAG